MMPEGFDAAADEAYTRGLDAMGNSSVLMNAAGKFRAGGADGLNSYLNQLAAQGYSQQSLENVAAYAVEYVTNANKANYNYAVTGKTGSNKNTLGKNISK